MKKLLPAAIAATTIALSSFAAAEESPISANVSLTSDYVWRGVSQTQNNGAIQGGFDYEHDSGFYAGVWASNVDFGSETSIEMDYYAGYAFDITESVSADVGIIHYAYPDESGLNFEEGYASVSFAGFTLGVNASGTAWADDSTTYVYLGYETELPGGVGLALNVAEYDFKDAYGADTDEEYNEWSVSFSKSYAGVDFALTYTDTSMDSDNCAAFAGDKDYCDSIVAISMSKSL